MILGLKPDDLGGANNKIIEINEIDSVSFGREENAGLPERTFHLKSLN